MIDVYTRNILRFETINKIIILYLAFCSSIGNTIDYRRD